ncbi:hypothetical protein [Magnetospirillum gryphiswaldense]|uniref:hypothetical protein n=1 Tax=Magnetospirillum gryphiswaldense TaxID=55518 RepID=UPI000D02614A|nr:hypothetical protein [Magnetospirillum gryphiswaldense]AVM76298.1 hypothetical protein MSR1_38420 [Magnetospirillum gryphiswaldense MSR-1]AVM80201.1 hypothetical protein MSR1L_38420 [Magnetospirillum gryphiswaldense]
MATKTMQHSTNFHPPHKSHPVWLGAGLAAMLLGGGVALWLLLGRGEAEMDPSDMLLAQMQAAAAGGNVPAFHALGGQLRAVQGSGRINVVASDVPASQCVKAGWRLAKLGTVIVNGVLPQRLSAAKLSELCEGGATLTWIPD